MNNLFKYPYAKQVLVSGDIHGDFKDVVFKLCVQYGLKDTLLIVAGDCGFGFKKTGYYKMVYIQVAGRLRKANNWVVFVRGNHDEPSYFTEEKVSHERWRCVPDYSIIQACGHDILCVGGAVSIDRYVRKEENARQRERGDAHTAVWWQDEAPVFSPEKIDAIPEDIRIDTVVTHTAPTFCELQGKQGLKSWAVRDPALIQDVEIERQTIDEIFQYLRLHDHPVKRWYYGHFHQSWSGRREGVMFSMLDIEEFKEIPDSDERDRSSIPKRFISLFGRNKEGVTLKCVSGETYELCGDLEYMRIIFETDGSICAVDPPGGPFLQVGGAVAGKTIKGLRREAERFFLELE